MMVMEEKLGIRAKPLIPLNNEQQERMDVLNQTPEYQAAREVLLRNYGQFLIYGGMAQLIEQRGMMRHKGSVVDESAVITGMGLSGHDFPRIDWERNGDVDLMVAKIGDGGELAAQLRERLGEGVEVREVAGPYPRVDVWKGGVEIMSVSDLESSAQAVRDFGKLVGQDRQMNGQSDEEVYFGAQLVQNFENPLVVTEAGVGIRQYSRDRVDSPILVWNRDSIYEVANVPDGALDDEAVRRAVMREYGYWVGKVVMLSSLGTRSYREQEREDLRQVMRAMSGWVGELPEVRQALVRRLERAINLDYLWTVRGLAETGAMWWFSPTLAGKIEERWGQRWHRVRQAIDEERVSNPQRSWPRFVEILVGSLDLSEDDKTTVVEELARSWKPKQEVGIAEYGRVR